MSTRISFLPAAVLATALLCSCEDSDRCLCPRGDDSQLPYLSVTWLDGNIGANLMPPVPVDPIGFQARLILANANPRETYTIRIPSADVILADNDSLLGTIRIETDWDGVLFPAEQDTVFFFKLTETERIFGPPCNERVWLDFLIQRSDGKATIYRPDPIVFTCVY